MQLMPVTELEHRLNFVVGACLREYSFGVMILAGLGSSVYAVSRVRCFHFMAAVLTNK